MNSYEVTNTLHKLIR